MRAVFVIAQNDFRDEELFETKAELEIEGIETETAAEKVKPAHGMLGGIANPDMTLKDIDVEDIDALIFVGGSGAAKYFDNADLHERAKEAYKKGKIVAAICIAPSILANAGLLEGKRATAYPSEEINLKNHRAVYTDSGVEADGKIITAKGPQYAAEFGRTIVKALKG
ncbi:MAG: DJ-1/PfpI family protein [Candidatus Aenigmarchaeota archaeon]|nr:DJ-1/PfpI family protein [Candidatus Aenigmarchaeota archaeon]